MRVSIEITTNLKNKTNVTIYSIAIFILSYENLPIQKITDQSRYDIKWYVHVVCYFISNDLSTMVSNSPRVDFASIVTVGETRWMRLETLSYLVDASSSSPVDSSSTAIRKWDRAVRTTKRSEDAIDAVFILAILRHSSRSSLSSLGDEIVCVRQFRPAIDAYTLELPAGLIDDGEDPVMAAIRELREETGYVGTVDLVKGDDKVVILPTFLSPGLSNESACLVRIHVDINEEINSQVYNDYNKGITQTDSMEVSERERKLATVLFPFHRLLNALELYLIHHSDVKLYTGLHTLAVGLAMGDLKSAK